MVNFMKNLNAWCEQNHGNAKLLAQHLGISETFVSFMVTGKKKIPLDLIKPISEFTGIPAKNLRPDVAEIFA